MTPDRWREVSRVYGAVLTKPESDRPTALASLCANDAELRAEVESLLKSGTDAALIDRAATECPSTLGLIDGRAIGTQIGVFRIESLLGVGGMGEVYRARDTKLNRDVAIKVLPPAFASDPDRLARFKREAQVLASLNHPNIGAIHGFEDSGGIHALVLELVEGPTLADKLARGTGLKAHGLPLDEALAIARQICDALEAAHEQGIIHRDLKPANIKVREDGTVKVLDFGLAKMAEGVSPPSPSPSVTQSPTITTPAMTTAGMILGTAAYMSPEQAKGKPADKRSDIWAFGVVLYEMLAGRRAFEAEDVAETLAEVIKGAPDWTALPASTPSAVQRLLRRALQKDARRRPGDMASLRLDLEEATVPEGTPAAHDLRNTGMRLRWLVPAAMAVLLAAGIAAAWNTRRPVSPREMRVEINTPAATQPESLAISPDGSTLVFTAIRDGVATLWLRPLSAERSRPLAGTENGSDPFWAPDSQSLGFFADGLLKRFDMKTGSLRTLAPVSRGWGGSWGTKNAIVFISDEEVRSVPANGGQVTTIVTKESPGASGGYRAPRFLPDGRHFLFFAVGVGQAEVSNGVFLGDTEGDKPRRVLTAEAAASYAPGHVLFINQGALFAQSFDPTSLTLVGEPFAVSERSIFIGGRNIPAVSVSDTGTIVYRNSDERMRRQFTWVNSSGELLGSVGDVDANNVMNPALSMQHDRIVYNSTINNNTDLWILDTARGMRTRFTSGPGVDQYPVWSPDGASIVFSSVRADGFQMYQKDATGSGPETLLLSTPPRAKVASDWSRDGRFILFRHLGVTSGFDIWALPMTGERTAFPVVQSDADERDAQFSPDGRWIAFQSNRTGRWEIYVQQFPKPGRVAGPLSAAGGADVRWSQEGDSLYYIGLDRRLMRIPLRLDAGSDTVDAQPAVRLFDVHLPPSLQRQQYVVAGKDRFLMNYAIDDETGYPITMVLNPSWIGAAGPMKLAP